MDLELELGHRDSYSESSGALFCDALPRTSLKAQAKHHMGSKVAYKPQEAFKPKVLFSLHPLIPVAWLTGTDNYFCDSTIQEKC